MHQPVVFQPLEVLVDGITDANGLVEYWGVARLQPNGKYQCLAQVGESLCRVEVEISEVRRVR